MTPEQVDLRRRQNDDVKLVAVASGKGGVGKSTVSLGLARALAGRGRLVGLLDADIYGPDIPLMLGLKQTRELRRWDLGRDPRFGRIELEPVEVAGIKVMSVGFLLAEPQMFAMPAMLASFALEPFALALHSFTSRTSAGARSTT